MAGELQWLSDERCVVDGTVFRLPPHDAVLPSVWEDGELLLLKYRRLLERYIKLLTEERHDHIVELGIFHGGSTAFIAKLVEPRRLVAIDRDSPGRDALIDLIAREGREEAVRVYDGVEQADRARLASIVDAEFADEPIDLVFDDCSHLNAPTLASFNELFPRLRPGGVYSIEDWQMRTEDPLIRLAIELCLALPATRGLIAEVTFNFHTILIRRGEAPNPIDFDLSATVDSAARRQLREALLADSRSPTGERPVLASFNESFLRLRPGATYTIAGWRAPDADPLGQLVVDFALAMATTRELIDEVTFDSDSLTVRRGSAPSSTGLFDLEAAAEPDERALLFASYGL